MNLSRIAPLSLIATAALAMPATAAFADTVIYDGVSLIQGQQAFSDTFSVSAPGALTISLSNIPWLDTVSNLSGFVSNASGEIGNTLTGAGSETMNLTAGTYYAHWFGDAAGQYNLGVVGLNITFEANGTSVALPPSLVLMLSGLGLLFGWQNRRAPNVSVG